VRKAGWAVMGEGVRNRALTVASEASSGFRPNSGLREDPHQK